MYEVNGKTYSTLQEVADVYSLPVSTILTRIDQGLSMEDAVSASRWSFTSVTINGVNYPSIASAARDFGLEPGLVRSRLGNGWPIEEALEIKPHIKKIKNHNNKGKEVCVNGIKYSSIKEAALAHDFAPRFIANRIAKGLTIEQALEIEPFPEWFVPGKGQKRTQLAQQRKQEREKAEKETGLRLCSCCGQMKPLENFHGQLTISSRCRDCISASFLRYKYNISLSDFISMKTEQNGQCKICKCKLEINEESSLRTKNVAVDHCHKTGLVRGLLCSKCNKGLGHFGDNPELLKEAAKYLEDFRRPKE